MRSRSQFIFLAIVMGIGTSAICFAQQDQSAPPAPATTDSNNAQAQENQTQPPAASPPTEEPQRIAPATHEPTQAQTPAKPAVKKRKPIKKKSASTQSGKVVVRNGGTKDNSGQLTPAMSPDQELHSRENTAQLLATTDSNLKKVTSQQLSTAQQSMLDQIRAYVRQAKAAADSGDLTRAHTLAYKAHLLSDALASK
jgi:hypothetical protein